MHKPEARFAVIGGTGFSDKATDYERIKTDYGSVRVGHLQLGGRDTIFLARHQGLEVPSQVNYRANVQALKRLNAVGVFSVSAAGRMHQDVLPGHLVNVSDLDWDHTGRRKGTFAQKGSLIIHAPLATIYSDGLRTAINESWEETIPEVNALYRNIDWLSVGFHPEGTYYNSEATWFNPEAREARLRATVQGIRLIGQTAVPEGPLLREMGVPNALLGMCTDHSTFPGAVRVSHAAEGGVVDVARTTSLAALALLDRAVRKLPTNYSDQMVDAMFRGSIFPSQVDMKRLKKKRPKLAGIVRGVLDSQK